LTPYTNFPFFFGFIEENQMTTKEQYSEDLLVKVFNTIPSLIFVVDNDVQIHEYNAAAAALLAADRSTILRRRGGEALHCLHSRDVPEGCGRAPVCKDCVIRNSVSAAFQGNKVVRSRHKMELIRDGHIMEIYTLITASPFLFHGTSLVLLVVEDISEIMELKRIIPICAICKQVRNDKDYWMQVELYLKEHLDIDFSHGLCPDCYKKEMNKLTNLNKGEKPGGGDS
jgi:hypothetical protein